MHGVTRHPFTPLRHKSVRLLWSAAVVSDIGTWVQQIVVGSLIAANTSSGDTDRIGRAGHFCAARNRLARRRIAS